MIFILTALTLFIGLVLLAWKMTNSLLQKFYRMAKAKGCAERYESIVRLNRYTQPRDLYRAYQEAISCTGAA